MTRPEASPLRSPQPCPEVLALTIGAVPVRHVDRVRVVTPRPLALVVLGLMPMAVLAGCAVTPSHEQAKERFAIEIAATYDLEKDDPAIQEIAETLAGDAAEGKCNDPDYWRLATSPLADNPWDEDLQYIWAAACSVLYKDSLDDDLEEAYVAAIIQGASGR